MTRKTSILPASLHLRRNTWLRIAYLTALVALPAACSHKSAPAPASPQPSATTQPASAAPTPQPTPSATAPSSGTVQAQMRNVFFRFSASAGAHIETLTGEFVPTGNNPMPIFDDKTSFAVKVKSARISITPAALANILNTFVFNKSNSPLKDLSMKIEDDKVHVKGKLASKGDLPFETVGSLSTTPDGRIRIHSEKVKAFKIPIKGMMNLFGLDLAKMLDTSKIDGIDTDKDDLLLNMSKLLPPPHIEGAVTAVHIENGEIVTNFGGADRSEPLEKGNYMAFKGGQLRFGKLTMQDSDLIVLDLDPGDPLDWYQDRYKDQLVAGESKITPTFGLRTYVKDFAKLPRAGKPGQKGESAPEQKPVDQKPVDHKAPDQKPADQKPTPQ
jgi:hypothetical protein